MSGVEFLMMRWFSSWNSIDLKYKEGILVRVEERSEFNSREKEENERTVSNSSKDCLIIEIVLAKSSSVMTSGGANRML